MVTRLLVIAMVFCVNLLLAQSSNFIISVDRDTVGIDETLYLTYSFENMDVSSMETPTLKGFDVITRTTITQNTSIINGERKSSTAFTYLIKPTKVGEFLIDADKIKNHKSNQLKVWVVEGVGEKSSPNNNDKLIDPFNEDFSPFFKNWDFPFPVTPIPQEKDKRRDIPTYTI